MATRTTSRTRLAETSQAFTGTHSLGRHAAPSPGPSIHRPAEARAWSKIAANAHDLDALKRPIGDLRRDLGDDRLPFVARQVGNSRLINEQMAALLKTVPFTGCASAEGLTLTDGLHFDTASVVLLGRRYAEEMRRLRGQLAQNRRQSSARSWRRASASARPSEAGSASAAAATDACAWQIRSCSGKNSRSRK